MTEDERGVVIATLVEQSLADHLGDVRDAERRLWGLLGIPELHYTHPAWDFDDAYRITAARLHEGGVAGFEDWDRVDD